MGDAERASTSARYLAAGGAGGDAWAAEARAEGRRGTQRIVQAGEVPAPGLVAERLGVEPGQAVIARRRIMYADDEPGTCPRVVDTSEPGPGRGRVGGIFYGDEGLLAR
ncbi:UTRA domain-containing protein, partial [Streptomyces koyangensis]|uniref:UTRA domain-containing protein n=1 Tax=Streptomyces koyangensis TaxID=188770 RepID=UPI003C2D5652